MREYEQILESIERGRFEETLHQLHRIRLWREAVADDVTVPREAFRFASVVVLIVVMFFVTMLFAAAVAGIRC